MPEHPITTVAKINEFKKKLRNIPEKVINYDHRGWGPETKAKFKDNQEAGSQFLIWPLNSPFQNEINFQTHFILLLFFYSFYIRISYRFFILKLRLKFDPMMSNKSLGDGKI